MLKRDQAALFSAVFTVAATGATAQELPVPCVSCTGGPPSFVSSGAANYVVNGNIGTVNQQSDRAILNWQSFNVGANSTVNFLQPSSTSTALNRIFQGDPSRILGSLNANGQVYLINQNGIVFGQGAQVNTSALVASTLNVSDQVFNGLGIVGAINNDPSGSESSALAAFEGQSSAAIRVEQGASLKSSDRIILVGSEVENRGKIETPGGQAILAASGDRVYLASDSELRGLLVEVDTGGSVTNLGEIIAERGNVTLAGLAVNQSGRIRATTSVNVNGSIRLLARDGASAVVENGVRVPVAGNTGTLTFGVGSATEVMPERNSTETAIDLQEQLLSSVEAVGRSIEMRAGAGIMVTGGNVSLNAVGGADTSIFLENGSYIDVSGDDGAVVAMERNQGRIKLFGNELADAPVQRDGPLARQEIAVDVRRGTPITDISRLRDDIKRGVGERLSAGGTVTLAAEGGTGNVILESGSTIDVSGGQVNYLSGFLETTKLVGLDGRVVDIGAADPNTPYSALLGQVEVQHERWGVTEVFRTGPMAEFHEGYVEGKDAGSLNIFGAGIAADGRVLGNTVTGALQRQPASGTSGVGRAADQLPLGGLLSITREGVLAPDMVGLAFATTATATAGYSFGDRLPVDQPLTLSAQALFDGGINRLRVNVPGQVLLPEEVSLQFRGGGELAITGDVLQIDGDVTAPSGNISMTARNRGNTQGSITLSENATIDARGTWVNDLPELNGGQTGNAPLFLNGGQVSLVSRGDLTLSPGSLIDVSAGAQLRAGATIRGGNGGSISLTSAIPDQNVPTTLDLGATLRGYGFGSGGRLRLSAAAFQIGEPTIGPIMPAPEIVSLDPSFFAQGGISGFEFSADRGSFEVAPDTTISIRPPNLQLTTGFQARATGSYLPAFTEQVSLPDSLRAPSSFSVSIARAGNVTDAAARLRIGDGARIETDAGGSIALASDSDIYIGGTLRAAGGGIRATLNNPSSSNETGFRADQALRLGEQAHLDTRGVARVTLDEFGNRSGDVLGGGQVTLTANRGFIIADGDSLIDVSGTSQQFDLPNVRTGLLEPTQVASDAGAIRITAAEGAYLFGALIGSAGGAGAAAGTLAVTMDATRRDPGDTVAANPGQYAQFPDIQREIIIGGGAVSGGFAEGVAIPSFLHGKALLSADRIGDGRFDVLDLTVIPLTRASVALSPGQVRFDGDVSLRAGRRISLDAAVIASSGQTATIEAPYVSIGPTQTAYRTTATPAAGGGRIRVDADHIDLRGNSVFSGFAEGGDRPAIELASRGDIRMIGTRFIGDASVNSGSLTALADISFNAAQIYPATLTDFSVSVTGEDGRIAIMGGRADTLAPSAAGVLRLSADTISQGGVLRAPFGEIHLEAANRLVLEAGSITSTSGAGMVLPFGVTEFGESWIYPLGDVTRVLEGAPEKSVLLQAPEIELAAGSKVDISGGGDLLAYEFVKGPGGSRDILLGDNPEGSFAIVPAWSSPFGAFDPLESAAAGIEPGSIITLAGGGDIPAGEYARLPARYAMLPGAYLLTPVAGQRSVSPFDAVVSADGVTAVVAGRTGFAGTDVHATQWSAYSVMSGTQVRTRAEYNESVASQFFSRDTSVLPADAGRLVIDADRSIRIEGMLAAGTAGGRAAQVDFVADRLSIVNSRTPLPQTVELVDEELRNFGAASLLIGGTRAFDGESIDVTVSTLDLTVEDGVDLAAPEILLAARDQITVASGARVTGTGAGASSEEQEYSISGNGAFVRVTSGGQADIERTNASGESGRVTIEDGATLSADGSILVEATRDVVSAGNLVTDGGSLSLAASLISFGNAPPGTSGLVLSSEDVARFSASELRLNSRSTIDFHDTMNLDLNRVRFDSAGIRSFGLADVSIGAAELTLGNSHSAASSTLGNGTGTLAFLGETVDFDAGAFDISGFDGAQIMASREIVGSGDSSLHVHGDLRLTAPRLTADAGVNVSLSADGLFETAASGAPPDLAAVDALGARLAITAAEIRHGGRIELPSGIVALSAAGQEGISLLSGSSLDLSGRNLDFAGKQVGSPGGSVTLTASLGSIDIAGSSRIDVSGASGGGHAGSITVAGAAGAVSIGSGSVLRGSAANGEAQGSFELAAGSLTNGFSELNSLLNTGGFTERRSVALGTGDVNIASSESVRAHEFSLTVDTGRIDVSGRIDASGDDGGDVRLSARDGITLHGSARIDARGSGADARGGNVELATRTGAIDIRATDTAEVATIAVAGRDAAGASVDSGHVNLRAPRVGTTGIAITSLAGRISGAERIDLEGFKAYETATINGGLLATVQAETGAFMANAGAIEGQLGLAGDARFHLLPGVDIVSSGDLTLNGAWDLFSWRDGSEAGVLTLRAAGNLNLNQSLSDGFALRAIDFLPERDTVQTGTSWSYRLVGGAVRDSADPLRVADGVGNVTVANNVFVRTGTGSIDVAAGNDVILASGTSSIYTAGENRGTGILDPIDAEILLRSDFVHHGGDIRIHAGRDVRGVSNKPLPDWLPRLSGEYVGYRPEFIYPAAWAIDASKFYQGIGALGGGNITVQAGGAVDSMTMAIPTNGLPFEFDGSDMRVAGGGDLKVEAAGDVRGGMFVVGSGQADIRSGGAITNESHRDALLPILQIGDAQVSLEARIGVGIESVFNSTVAEQNPDQGLLDYFFFPSPSYFFTYSGRSAVSLTAIAGDATLRAKGSSVNLLSNRGGVFRPLDPALVSLYPGTLSARSLQQDVRIDGALNMFPSPTGGLELLAGRNVTATGAGILTMPDGDEALLPTPLNPAASLDSGDLQVVLKGHAATPVHEFDDVPVTIVAQRGNVGPSAVGNTLAFELPKQTRVFAGEDISNVTLKVQHSRSDDVSVIEAGRDIVYTANRQTSGQLAENTNQLEVSGPGRVDLVAGRSVDFGSAIGVESLGDSGNTALADQGADINIWTGHATRPDYDAFIDRYLSSSTKYGSALGRYLEAFDIDPSLSAVDNLRALPEIHQREFIRRVFFEEIKQGGLNDTATAFDAIKILFPSKTGYEGDLKSFLSHITTVDGGDINILVPGGLVNAGVASSGSLAKGPEQLGIVVQGEGTINAFTRHDFEVNSSRVFALDGGDILVWSSEGDIDAGRGARSALAIPPPVTSFDAEGNVTIEFPAAISGSGIRAAVTTQGRKPGNVYLFAPAGVVDAGDAGIGSAGNITIVATEVIGADNIEVGGVAVGIPVDTGGLGASLAGVSSVASSASSSALEGAAPENESQAPAAEAALGWLDVFVLGFGEETCKPDDAECLQRNRK